MPIDYTNPDTLKFLIENFTKENERRILWFNKNKEKVLQLAVSTGKKCCTEDVYRASVEPCMTSLAVHHTSSGVNRRRKPIRDGLINLSAKYNSRIKAKLGEGALVETGEMPNSLMKPIESDVSEVLYETKPDGGRIQYLRRRARKLPEERYFFCETSNNVCGWKLNESRMQQTTEYRRVYTYKRDALSRSGPQPDPPYCIKPLKEENFKCS
ncbi:unnamed protein product [Leptosia nina]|uniref:Sperm microtubule inner protein 1 C-terminal domain-containing protein n=1 Tax=Leptosia nina TaxID=320188 RepID=A0AAV1IYL9_9NEOP